MNGVCHRRAGLERTEWYGKGLFRSASQSEMVCFQNYKNRNRLLNLLKNNGLRNLPGFEWSHLKLSISQL
ncbi:hypothetical protein DF021_12955 [Burkholderia stagnalis]|uniref:Uncharacterized protein n=1 Tax=Burkholderia stagnalis TaxID=1503054 RepID=A0A6L3MT09_9BURK|nr:hypothetical protein F7R25_23470 [Burkholderia stagnalis]RQQ57573.1 hypothetical protein DF158_20070 [Burkholderia stagnalis]RQQ66980.1 hypothetical protein DF139_21290 [Burkholderia stagnalis]RQQ68200.1 hypothetical protein DF137_17150 [Burkholderia stagnalis]RQQ79424.1 hypothetical protein DF138_18065 [Burkholderia stagnalis]